MDRSKSPQWTRRNALKTAGVSISSFLGIPAVTAKDPDSHDIVPCCGGGGVPDSYPVELTWVDSVSADYHWRWDFEGAVGITAQYWGSYTNPNYPDGGYLHDFVFSGFSTSKKKKEDSNNWQDNKSIISQSAIVENNDPSESGIVSSVGSQTEWIGESHNPGSSNSNDRYIDAMKTAVETAITEVSEKVSWTLSAFEFISELNNNQGGPPNGEDSWTVSWDYDTDTIYPELAHDCTNTVRFAVTSPGIDDYIDITTKQTANIPAINDQLSESTTSIDWYYKSSDSGAGLSSDATLESLPTEQVSNSELPPYQKAQEMADRGAVQRVKLPIRPQLSSQRE